MFRKSKHTHTVYFCIILWAEGAIYHHQLDIFRRGVKAGAEGKADSAPSKQDKGAQPVFGLEKRVKDLNLKRPVSSLRRALYRKG